MSSSSLMWHPGLAGRDVLPQRLLLAVDAGMLPPSRLDLQPLAQVREVTLLWFTREEVQVWLALPRAVKLHLVPQPDYEPRFNAFLATTTAAEARNAYTHVRLLATADDAQLHALVRHLSQQGIPTTLTDSWDAALDFSGAAAEHPQAAPLAPREGKRRRRRRVKLPTSPENLLLVMRALLAHFRLGEVYSKTQISPIIHKETRRNVKDLFPYKNLTGLYRYLLSQEIIEEVDNKSFRVISLDWSAPSLVASSGTSNRARGGNQQDLEAA